ncbi:amidohydrolase [Polaribacter dokdonensis]|uniref:Omega-amidase YafV n=1 Tax=Polaribacter dokdonensis DSW-5 TaxID=1300348 RepID=A0A0N0CF82_9FLAO|nr:amidohydrolase [Polaribacter dokdonensis]KOY51508.1 Carbon-nitrogen hydrolase [Polaribacter dokdonensis DSW-5]SEE09899.1 Predicted amidohydrolase [Polaribacter dokdonensis DSW-5]
MKNELHVVGIQADLVWENPSENLKYFEDKITDLPTTTDLVVLPEMFTTGFTMHPNNVAESMNGSSITWMKRLAQKFDFAIIGSLVIKEDNKFYNRLVFVHPSGKINTYNKRHSFTLAGEHKVYTSGKEILTIDYKGWKIRPLICYDLRFPVWARNTENYDLLIYMANWPITRIKAWDTLLKARAIENMSYTIGVNRTGSDANNYQYSGGSIIVDFLGEELSSLAENKIGTTSAILKKENQDKVREKLGFLSDKDAFNIDF